MSNHDFLIDDGADPRRTEPSWVTAVLWLLPKPVFAVVAIAVATFVSSMSYFFASVEKSSVAWGVCGVFAALAGLIAIASVSRQLHRRHRGAPDSKRSTGSTTRPTVAIVVFLISTFAWLMTIGLHVFRNFFAANRPGGLKYNITLALAVACSYYMRFHGKSVIREHFGARGGRNIVISPGQALVVLGLLLCFGGYFAWIMV